MNRFSLRVRLAVLSAVGVLVVMTLAGMLQFMLLRRGAINRVDRELSDAALAIEGASAVDELLARLAGGVGDQATRSVGKLIADRQNLLVNEVAILGTEPNAVDLVGSGQIPVDDGVIRQAQTGEPDFFYTTEINGTPYRVMSEYLGSNNATVVVRLIARSISELVAEQANFAVFLIGGTLLTVLVAGGLGYLITRQAMRPVRRLATTASDIAQTGDLKKRVVEGAQDRDLSNLTETFNDMLDTLETAYDKISTALDAERRFVANASHELRTPLTTVRGNVDYLGRIGVDHEVVDDLRVSSDRLASLVASLTQLAREEAGVTFEGDLVDFDELVRDVAREPAYDIDGVDMNLDIEDNVWVLGSESSLATVVRNLLGNALKYGEARIDVSVATENGYAVLDVRDDGPGVPADDVDQVFERFWRAPEAKGAPGSGLGLSIVKSSVKAHKGDVQAFPGPGGRFEVRLPSAQPPKGEAVRRDEPDRAGESGAADGQ